MRILVWFSYLLLTATFANPLAAQTPVLTSGEITVQLTQGLDSAMDPKGLSQGVVTKSTNPAVPKGASVWMGVESDPASGGYTVKLLQLGINGQTTKAASSAVVTAPDFFNKALEKTRAKGQPEDSASGTRVFLPARMIVRFTLTTPSTAVAAKRAPEPQSPAKPKVWKVQTIPEISDAGTDVQQTAAILEGTVTYRGKTTPAYLVMHCDFPTSTYPQLLPLEMILGAFPEMLSAPGAPGAPVDVSDFAHSQLGNSALLNVDANGQNRSTGARLRFFYDAPDMREIVDGGGQTLRLSLAPGEFSAPPDTAVQFSLPTDNSLVKQTMSACLLKSDADAEAIQAKTVAACPVKTSKVLTEVSLKYSDTGKDVTGDMDEMDNGGTWKLSAATKTHPARKTVLNCTYRDPGKEDGTPLIEKVPVPITARMCEFTVHRNELHNEAACLSSATAPPNPVAAKSPTQSAPSVAASQPPTTLERSPIGGPLTFGSVSLGMTVKQAQILAAQNGGATDVGQQNGTVGLIKFKDTRFEYQVEFNDQGRARVIIIYPVEKNSKSVGIRKGTLYSAAIQAFGQPKKATSDELFWEGPGQSHVQYDYAPSEMFPVSLELSDHP